MKATAAHPLDPLSSAEIVECASICRAYAAEQALGELRFNTITLRVQALVSPSTGAGLPAGLLRLLSLGARGLYGR